MPPSPMSLHPIWLPRILILHQYVCDAVAQTCNLFAHVQEKEGGLVPARLHRLCFPLFLLIPLFAPILVIIGRTKLVASRPAGAPRSPTLCAQIRPELARRAVQSQQRPTPRRTRPRPRTRGRQRRRLVGPGAQEIGSDEGDRFEGLLLVRWRRQLGRACEGTGERLAARRVQQGARSPGPKVHWQTYGLYWLNAFLFLLLQLFGEMIN